MSEIIAVFFVGIIVIGVIIACLFIIASSKNSSNSRTRADKQRTHHQNPYETTGNGDSWPYTHVNDTSSKKSEYSTNSSKRATPPSQAQYPEKRETGYKPSASVSKPQAKTIVYPQNLSELYDSYAKSSDGSELERKVAEILEDLPGEDHYVLQNLYVPALIHDTTTEIDVLMIHPTGLYVFECKNYNGYIQSESPTRRYWDVSYASGKQVTLYSPVLQNRGHICALERYLSEYDRSQSWIVFGDGAIVDVPSDPSEFTLTKLNGLSDSIRASVKRANVCFSPSMVTELYNELYPLTQVSDEVKQKHIEDVLNGRIFTGSSGAETEYLGYDIPEDILQELRQELKKNPRYRSQAKSSRARAKPQYSGFYPDSISVTDSVSAEKMKKHQKFYEWVKTLDHWKLPAFCKILLEGNGFTSIKMPQNPVENIISAEGGGNSYKIKISNKKKDIDGHFIESLDTKFRNNSTDVLIVVSSWQFAPEAIHASKKFGFMLWDCESLRCLMDNVEKNGTAEQIEELKRFMG